MSHPKTDPKADRKIYIRKLDLPKLLAKKSHFLFGPRSTGKTTLIESQLQEALVYDLLDDSIYHTLLRNPSQIEQENKSAQKIIVIDEIQKLPKLLDEVHRLIKKHQWTFLLTGSSARKLKTGSENLLGGRAWEAKLFPLVSQEINNFELIKYLNRGGLPFVYDSNYFEQELKSYIHLYLREEVLQEGLVKKYEHFLNFLDVIGLCNGQELNFERLASDAQVPSRTIINYLQILEDTLLGFQLYPFRKTKNRKAVSKSKFYFFDLGVAKTLAKIGEILPDSKAFGDAFEHFIIQEIRAYLSYSEQDCDLRYWRTTDGYEVDCIIGDLIALEIKSTKFVTKDHLKGLVALREEGLFKHFYCVCQEDKIRFLENGVKILPWQGFLKQLWAGQMI